MPERREIAAAIRRIIEGKWPARFSTAQLRSDVPLDDGGFGLDSVEIVEVLVAFEDSCGVPFGDDLLEVVPLTIDRLAEYLARQTA